MNLRQKIFLRKHLNDRVRNKYPYRRERTWQDWWFWIIVIGSTIILGTVFYISYQLIF